MFAGPTSDDRRTARHYDRQPSAAGATTDDRTARRYERTAPVKTSIGIRRNIATA